MDAVGEREGRHAPVLDGDILVDEVGHLRLDLDDLAAGQPAEEVDPVDALVDEGAAGHLRRVGEPARRAGPGQSSAIDQRPVWCRTAISPISPASIARLERLSEPHEPLKRDARDAGRLHRRDHPSAWATVIAIGLPRMMCLPARAAARSSGRGYRDRRRDVDDVDVVAAEQLVVVAYPSTPKAEANSSSCAASCQATATNSALGYSGMRVPARS